MGCGLTKIPTSRFRILSKNKSIPVQTSLNVFSSMKKWTNTTSDLRSTEVKMGRIVRATFCCHHYRKNYFRNNHKHENIKVHDNITLFLRNEKYKMLWTFFLLWNAVKCLFIVRVVHAKNKKVHLTVWQKICFSTNSVIRSNSQHLSSRVLRRPLRYEQDIFKVVARFMAKISGWE